MRKPWYYISALVLFSLASTFFYKGLQSPKTLVFQKHIQNKKSEIEAIKDQNTKVVASAILEALKSRSEETNFETLSIRNTSHLKIDTQSLGKIFLTKSSRKATITIMAEDPQTLLIEIKIEQQENLDSELTIRLKR